MVEGIRWKNGARCAVTLSFDVDGESPWIYRDAALRERPLHMSMGAYGPKTGVPRILELLDRYDIRAGFFIPGWIIEHYPDMWQEGLTIMLTVLGLNLLGDGPRDVLDPKTGAA